LKTAQHEADLILQQARHRAEEEMGESRERMSALRAELRTLEDQKQQFFLRMRNLLRNQSEILAATMEAEEKDSGARAASPAGG
jgi:DNA-binding SARP family transcriptional activator